MLVIPMEVEIRADAGVEEFNAYAFAGGASVIVEFNADYDLDRALTDVRETVDRAKPKLPQSRLTGNINTGASAGMLNESAMAMNRSSRFVDPVAL